MYIKLIEKIANMDVSDLKNGEYKNVNDILANRVGDYGVDNKKNIYCFTGDYWRSIKW